MVFDGRSLLVKKKTEEQRKKVKKANLEKANSFLEQGDEIEARKYFSRAIKITKEMIYHAIDLCRQMRVDFILAPYESDAQIAFLIKNSYAHIAISEDSDLIVYGCPKIILKLAISGDCQYVNMTPYKESINRIPLKDKQLKNFLAFSRETMIYACIMAGCDYLPSIKGIGIKKAVDFLERSGGKIDGTIRRLQFEKTFMGRIPEDYAKTVKKIALVFHYQRIFDPAIKGFGSLEPLPEDLNNEATNLLIGEKFEQIENFATGDLDIKKLTKREIENADLKDLMIGEVARKLENYKKYEKIEVDRTKTLGSPPYKGLNNERKNESFEVNEGEIDFIITPDQPKSKNYSYQGKMDEQIDFLFDVCKELAVEFGGKEGNSKEKEELENEDERKNDEENGKNMDDDEENQKNGRNSLNIDKNQTIFPKNTKIPAFSETKEKKKEVFPINVKVPIESPKNINKLFERSSAKLQAFLEPPKNLFNFQEKTKTYQEINSPVPKSPKNSQYIEMKSPENPFLIKNHTEKKENFLLDSLAKLSTEKLNNENNENKNNKESTSKIPSIIPKKTEEKAFIFNSKISDTMKKAPEKRKDDKKAVFYENQKENEGLTSIFSSFAKKSIEAPVKKVKTVDFAQRKMQNFYSRNMKKY